MQDFITMQALNAVTREKKDGSWCPFRVIPGPTGRMTKGDKIRARRERQCLAKEKAEAEAVAKQK